MVSSGLEDLPFNRTSMELKHAWKYPDGEGSLAFNRTSMELKRHHVASV